MFYNVHKVSTCTLIKGYGNAVCLYVLIMAGVPYISPSPLDAGKFAQALGQYIYTYICIYIYIYI